MSVYRAHTGGPTTNIRVYLRASKLPKSRVVNQQPDTLARISWLSPSQNGSPLSPLAPPPDENDQTSLGGESEDSTLHQELALNETEVVYKNSSPRWTASFPAQYEYGSQLLFFVDIFALRNTTSIAGHGIRAKVGNIVGKPGGMKHMGRAVFDVRDVLGGVYNIKARRLRRGGIVYAYVEQLSSYDALPSRSLSLPTTSHKSSYSHILHIRLSADSLAPTLSMRHRIVPTRTKPDTYYEISRRSSGAWIVVYRSPPVKESISPMWDEAMVELNLFVSGSSSHAPEDLGAYHVMITVYEIKKRKCKEIGSFETTVESLVDVCRSTVKVMGQEDENSTIQSGDQDGGGKKKYQLRPTSTGGADTFDKTTGSVTVVKANIRHPDEGLKLSQTFFSSVDKNDNANGTIFCEMIDGDSSEGVDRVFPAHPQPKFSEYVRSGILDIEFCVAIDFTASNGDPRIPGTQHYSRDGMMNDYEEAIVALGSTIEKYSSNREYPVWGFGAKYDGEVRHIFQCGGDSTSRGTEGILDAYRTVFETDLIMSGPTVIDSVLRAAAVRSKRFYNAPTSKKNMQYCVLLILTDGMVSNLPSTQELVLSYRELHLPMSVIIIGIGRADFTEFHHWNQAPSNVRGNFRFVEFREHQFDPDTLSRKALEKVPQEVVNYFVSRNVRP